MAITPRILAVRPDRFGDLPFTLPAVAALRGALPGTTIDVLAPAGPEEVAAGCPDADRTASAIPVPPPAPESTGWTAGPARAARMLRGQFG